MSIKFDTEDNLSKDQVLERKCYYLHDYINFYLKPMPQKDLISLWLKIGLDHVAEKIFSYLDVNSLCVAELVCKEWYRIIREGMIWKKLIESKVRTNSIWREHASKRRWMQHLFKPKPGKDHLDSSFYKIIFPIIEKEVRCLKNWRTGRYKIQRINCNTGNSKRGIYCLQYDEKKIVSGHRDHSIKIWDRKSLKCIQILTGHKGSVLCLQFNDKFIISGSSDTTIKIWNVNSGEMIRTINHYSEPVLHLRFKNGILITCSKDWTIAVWDITCQALIENRLELLGHQAAINTVDFDQQFIISGSADRSIKIWKTSSGEFVRILNGHQSGIVCLQYRYPLLVSGSSDHTIRLWDVESGLCLRVLKGHKELVRCITFDNQHIVSGAYDGKIKIWDLEAALDPKVDDSKLCLQTLKEHTGHVFRIQFDNYQMVSSSVDDTILIWDFLNFKQSTGNLSEDLEKFSTA